MKKAVLILLALLMVASLATAQGVKIGAWGRGFFAIAGTSAANSQIQLTPDAIGWYTPGQPRIGINVIGSSENVGFQIDLIADGAVGGSWYVGNYPTFGDQVKIWVKPISMLTVQIGPSCYDDALRGSAGFGMWNWLRMNGMQGDDFIFQRVAMPGNGSGAGVNFELALDPIEGLHAFYAIRGTSTAGNGFVNIADAVKCGMAGAGYTIPGIGMLRAQWLGGIGGDPGSNNLAISKIQAAFKLTAVTGLMVDLGDTTTLDGTSGSMAVTDSTISITGSYAVMPTLSLNALAMIKLNNLNTTMKVGWYGGIEAEYALPGDMVITADVRLDGQDISATPVMFWGGLLSIQKNFSNGLVGLGIEVTNAQFAGGTPAGALADGTTIQFAVPIRVEYWF